MARKFKNLSVGTVFEFEATQRYGMERGPWQKISARKYIKNTTPFGTDDQAHAHSEWNGHEFQVGSINVETVESSGFVC